MIIKRELKGDEGNPKLHRILFSNSNGKPLRLCVQTQPLSSSIRTPLALRWQTSKCDLLRPLAGPGFLTTPLFVSRQSSFNVVVKY